MIDMKKTLLLAAFALAGTFAFAQKPASGDKTVETSILLQTGTAPISFATPNLRLRYFIADDLAARVNFLYESSKVVGNFTENTDGTGGKGSATTKYSNFTFSPGIEKHFEGTSKLSPYVGGVLALSFMGASEEWENSANGTSYTKDVKATIDGANTDGDNAGSAIGVGLVLGADYYVTDALYLGAEILWGWETASLKESTTTVTAAGGASTKTVAQGASASGFGIMTSGVRLGWKF
jgi:outer membrane protein W